MRSVTINYSHTLSIAVSWGLLMVPVGPAVVLQATGLTVVCSSLVGHCWFVYVFGVLHHKDPSSICKLYTARLTFSVSSVSY